MTARHPTFALSALCLASLWLGGCAPEGPEALRDESSVEPTSSFRLPRPDLSAMDPQVARQLDDARAKAASAVASGAVDAEKLGGLADLYHAYELLEAAEILYAEAERLEPTAFRPAYMRGLVAYRQGRFEPARDAFRRAYEHLPEVDETSAERLATAWRLGQALRATRQPALATTFLNEAATSELCPAALFELGQLALEEDRPADAELFFKRVLSLQDDAAQVYFPLGQALRLQDKQDEARLYLDLAAGRERSVGGRAVCRDPLDASIGMLSTGSAAWITRGQHARFAGDSAGALTAFRRAVELAPDDPVAHQALAKGLAESGDWAAAEAELARALELEPDSPFLANDLATAALRLGKTTAARRLVETLLERRPSFGPALLTASRVDKAEGRFESALERLTQAAELRGEPCRTVLEKVDLLARLSRLDAARDELRQCLQRPSLAPTEGLRLAVALGRLGEAPAAFRYLVDVTESEAPPGVKAQAYFGLGGLLLQAGRRREAIESLRRATELDPSLEAAQVALQQLSGSHQND